MANLPAQHPALSLHLADDALTPLISSSRPRSAARASLTALTTSALTSRAAAHRVGMGAVERIVVEYPPPAAAAVVLQSYMRPPEEQEEEGGGQQQQQQPAGEGDGEGKPPPPPRLVGLVVARSPQDAREAQTAAARLERVGREFQSRWSSSSSSSSSGPDTS